MTAGAIPAPTVVPLRPPVLGKAKGLVSTKSIVIQGKTMAGYDTDALSGVSVF